MWRFFGILYTKNYWNPIVFDWAIIFFFKSRWHGFFVCVSASTLSVRCRAVRVAVWLSTPSRPQSPTVMQFQQRLNQSSRDTCFTMWASSLGTVQYDMTIAVILSRRSMWCCIIRGSRWWFLRCSVIQQICMAQYLYMLWPGVCLSVCLSVTGQYCVKMAEWIEMVFGTGATRDLSCTVL